RRRGPGGSRVAAPSPVWLRRTEQLCTLLVHPEPLDTSARRARGADCAPKVRRHVLDCDRSGERARPQAPLPRGPAAPTMVLRGRDHDHTPVVRIAGLDLPELEVMLLRIVAPSVFKVLVLVGGHVCLNGRLVHI